MRDATLQRAQVVACVVARRQLLRRVMMTRVVHWQPMNDCVGDAMRVDCCWHHCCDHDTLVLRANDHASHWNANHWPPHDCVRAMRFVAVQQKHASVRVAAVAVTRLDRVRARIEAMQWVQQQRHDCARARMALNCARAKVHWLERRNASVHEPMHRHTQAVLHSWLADSESVVVAEERVNSS